MFLRPVHGIASCTGHTTLSLKLTTTSARQLSTKSRTITAHGYDLHVNPVLQTCPGSRKWTSTRGPLVLTSTHMATLSSRRPHTTSAKGKDPERPTGVDRHEHEHDHDHEHEHEHGHSHSHSHSHSPSVLGFGHAHTHGEGGHGDAEQVVAALSGAGAFRFPCRGDCRNSWT